MQRNLTIILLFILYLTTIEGGSRLRSAPNLAACGNTVFDMTKKICFRNIFGEDHLCKRGEQICGDECYDPKLFSCDESVLYYSNATYGISPKPSEGETCGDRVCAQGQSCCHIQDRMGGPQCYDPNTQTCCLSNSSPTTICNINFETGFSDVCCVGHTECYDRDNYYCCLTVAPGGTGARICDIGELGMDPLCDPAYCHCVDSCRIGN
eukprot:TRINITY_DN1819_c0_g1_i1.p1 TRINITY_DN1819_c0_g1~~TRINITY_DN1819_c0_g1_i1.p1  ORF type:complete len:209 (+),score=24.64 TRINITY_DN1819_c0_g1_i1:240-866(+)